MWSAMWREDWPEERIRDWLGPVQEIRDALTQLREIDALTITGGIHTGMRSLKPPPKDQAPEVTFEPFEKTRRALQEAAHPGLAAWLDAQQAMAQKAKVDESRRQRALAMRARTGGRVLSLAELREQEAQHGGNRQGNDESAGHEEAGPVHESPGDG